MQNLGLSTKALTNYDSNILILFTSTCTLLYKCTCCIIQLPQIAIYTCNFTANQYSLHSEKRIKVRDTLHCRRFRQPIKRVQNFEVIERVRRGKLRKWEQRGKWTKIGRKEGQLILLKIVFCEKKNKNKLPLRKIPLLIENNVNVPIGKRYMKYIYLK